MVRSFPGPPRRSAGLVRIAVLTVLVLIAFYFVRSAPRPMYPLSKEARHPIDTLIAKAEKEFQQVLKKETHDLKSAARVYRERRGRHPPPEFDKWFEFARERKAVMVEDFFDQIYHDLGPYWGLTPAALRKEGWNNEMTINIRKHKATAHSEWFWTKIWLHLIQTIEHVLPDMDLPLNAMDEPRIVVPWEKINEYMEIERKGRVLQAPSEVVSEFQSLPPPGQGDKDFQTEEKKWEDTSMYTNSSTSRPTANTRQNHSGKLLQGAAHLIVFHVKRRS